MIIRCVWVHCTESVFNVYHFSPDLIAVWHLIRHKSSCNNTPYFYGMIWIWTVLHDMNGNNGLMRRTTSWYEPPTLLILKSVTVRVGLRALLICNYLTEAMRLELGKWDWSQGQNPYYLKMWWTVIVISVMVL